ncbi:MAG: hypothetical protein OEL57_04295 [Trichlorobacter sp.]|uniref:hypothetical protein n=1 Tax=Trichlorobacter sp. TaxID=2911007 RepID=UPI00256A97A6|nr:hypothetical protein [Trichlorobacter sp.]MDK9717114.1 hypothetical protein [Trichlorobacter sp.]
MRCPKCGYTSFESYDSCRKCSADLTEFKQSHGITSMVLPPSLCAEMAAGLGIETTRQNNTSPDTSNDMFTFDLPTEQQQTPAAPTSPFSFDDSPAPSFDTPTAAADPFASLMSSTPQPATTAPQAPAQGFEMNSFSWDDTPTPGEAGNAASGDAQKTSDDDFSSLFGDPVDANKK